MLCFCHLMGSGRPVWGMSTTQLPAQIWIWIELRLDSHPEYPNCSCWNKNLGRRLWSLPVCLSLRFRFTWSLGHTSSCFAQLDKEAIGWEFSSSLIPLLLRSFLLQCCREEWCWGMHFSLNKNSMADFVSEYEVFWLCLTHCLTNELSVNTSRLVGSV